MRRGVRAFVFLVASGGLPAAATPPPLSEDQEVLEHNLLEVQDALDGCGKAATRAGVYGAAEIDIVNGRRPAAGSAGPTTCARRT